MKQYLEKYTIPGEKYPVARTLDDIPEGIKYKPHAGFPKTGLHIGQRKLFLSEMDFLTKCVVDEIMNIVVYVGAAPSNKTWYLSQFFPGVKLILIDPAKFSIIVSEGYHDQVKNIFEINLKEVIDSEKDLFILRKMFSDFDVESINRQIEEIENFADKYNLLFISDIRTQSDDKFPGDDQILWNLAQQFVWVKNLNPKNAMVKFRLPFREKRVSKIANGMSSEMKQTMDKAKLLGVDFMEDYKNGVFRYFGGEVMLQCWEGISSTETRLIIKDIDEIREYDYGEYEDKLHFYNAIYRTHTMHENQVVSKAMGVDYCNDCALEARIWIEYSERFDENRKRDKKRCLERIESLSHFCNGRKLKTWKHGNIFSPGEILENIKNDLGARNNDREYYRRNK